MRIAFRIKVYNTYLTRQYVFNSIDMGLEEECIFTGQPPSSSQDGEWGSVRVKFSSPPKTSGGSCTTDMTNMPVADTRVWTIRKNTTSLALACNGVDIWYTLFSDQNRCIAGSDGNADRITFSVADNASTAYRRRPTGL